MEILMTVLWILLGILLILALLLFAPVSYKFYGRFAEETDARAKLGWLFFGVTFKGRQLKAKLLFFDVSKFLSPKAYRQEAPEHEQPRSVKDFWRLLNKVDVKKIAPLCILLIRRLVRAMRPWRFRAEGVVGFGCPCKTGRFIGLYEAAAAMFRLRDKVMLHGSFGEERFDLKVDFAGRFMPISVIVPVIKFIFAPDVQAMLKGMKA